MMVNFELIASLGDQPERRSMNYLVLGNSPFSSQYGYVANVGTIWQYLPSYYTHHKDIKNNSSFLNEP